MRSHKIYWDLARSTDISQDLLISHKIYWDLTRSTDMAKYIWHLILGLLLSTFDIWNLKPHFIFDIYWDLRRSTEISKYLLIWHHTFDIWRLVIDIWHFMTFDIWHLTFDIWHLTWLKVLTALALMLLILAQSYHIFTDGFWGYLQSKKNYELLTQCTMAQAMI